MVLLFTLIICLGAFYQFNDAFKRYVANYFGNYLACLLESGELPSLGYGGPALADTCNGEFQPFSLANGRPLKLDFSSAAPVAVGSADRGSLRSGGGGPVQEPGGAPVPDGGGQATGPLAERSYGGSQGSSSGGPNLIGSNSGSLGNVPLSKADAGGKNKNARFQDNTISEKELFDDGMSGRRPLVPLSENEQVAGGSKAKPNLAGGNDGGPSQKRLVAVTTAVKEVKVAEESLGFSDFIKYLLIAAIVLAMIIFFGGQALQISKGGEK
jgi:hypothetical protein